MKKIVIKKASSKPAEPDPLEAPGLVVATVRDPPKTKGYTAADKKHDWIMIREEFIQSHIQGRPITMAKLADKYNISQGHLRNRASKDKWTSVLEERLAAYDNEVAKRMATLSTKAIEKVQEEFVGNELEIRKRHANVARGLQAKAVKRLAEIPADQLKPAEALAMLKLGMDEERRAMGMPDQYIAPPEDSSHPEYKSIKAQIGDHRKVQQMGVLLLKAIKEGSKAQTEEENPLSAIGLDDLQASDAARDITPANPEV